MFQIAARQYGTAAYPSIGSLLQIDKIARPGPGQSQEPERPWMAMIQVFETLSNASLDALSRRLNQMRNISYDPNWQAE